MEDSTPIDSEEVLVAEQSEEFAAAEEPAVEVVEVIEEPPAKSAPRRGDRGKFVVEETAVVKVVEPVEVVETVASKSSVRLAALVYSPKRKNSESVAKLQKRLSDVGYAGARADLSGWFHDNTRAALVKWQTEHDLEPTGACEFEDMRYLFDGTDVEIIA